MKTTENMVLFWQDADIYSNFHPAPFTLDGLSFHCSEQAYMYGKARYFDDTAIAAAILCETTPMGCKLLGRSVQNFHAASWAKVSSKVMFAVCAAKFRQNLTLKAELLATGTRLLIEASPHDRIWGIGLSEEDPDALDPEKWLGENHLGNVLMAVRAALARPPVVL